MQNENKTEIVFSELESKKTLKRYVGGNIIFNSYYLSLDEAFDFAIKEHSEWLKMYPQLNIEYYVIDDKKLYSYYLKKRK